MRNFFRRFKGSNKSDSDLTTQPKTQAYKQKGFGLGRTTSHRLDIADEGVGSDVNPSSSHRTELNAPSTGLHVPSHTSSQTNVTSRERSPTIDASVHVSQKGVTYNIGGSAVVHLNHGSQFAQQLDKNPLDEIIRTLARSHNAEFDIVTSTARGACAPETRITILQKLGDWCNTDSVMLYWMNGMAGTGKTTIVFTLCKILQSANLLGASFFCSRSVPDCRNINLIIPTIAFQLSQRYPPFAEALAEALHKDTDILRRGLDVQLRKLIIEPWNAKKDQLPPRIVIVLDALDECDEGHSSFLRVIFNHVTLLPFKFMITSRPDFSIYDTMKAKDSSILSTFILHEVEKDMVQADIAKYLELELSHRTTPDVLLSLTELSGSLFVYAATLARLFKARNVNIRARLQILQTPSSAHDKSTMMASLDELYKGVLAIAFGDGLMETEIKEIKEILYTVVCAREPLTRRGIAELWGIETEELDRILESLLSVISVPYDMDAPITVFHASFPDFMLDQLRSGSFYCDPPNFHLEMGGRCLALMKSQLHQNMCHLNGRPPNDSVGSDVIHKHISSGLRYASTYWPEHWILSDCSGRQAALGLVHIFLTTKALCWFECLSLAGQLAISIHGLEMVQDTLEENTELSAIVHDCLQLIQLVYEVVDYSAIEIYHEALIWIPLNSSLRIHYASLYKQAPRVLCGLPATWTGPEQIINIPNYIDSIAISQDGRSIISGSRDNTVRIWNVRSHTEECVLRGHSKGVNSVAISGDGSRAVSGSDDGNVHVWNLATREAILTLQSDRVWGVALSPDDKWIASGHEDGSIHLWGTMDSHIIHCKGHTNRVRSLPFTHDGTRLVSGSDDNTARIWNAITGVTECILHGHTGWVLSVTCSPSGDKIATGSTDNTARLWDMSGNELHVLRAHSENVDCVAFMPNGKQVVTGSSDKTMRIWDVMSGDVVHIFAGLVSIVGSVAVFPSGLKIASSSDSTISIWNLRRGDVIGGEEQNNEGSMPNVEAESVAFSPNGQRILLLLSLRILDTATLEEKALLESFNPGWGNFSGAWSTSGNRVAASIGEVIRVWELTGNDTVAKHLTFEGHTWAVITMSFSHKENQLVSASFNETMLVWDVATGEQICIMRGSMSSAVFSHDDTQIFSSASQSVHIWNAQSGEKVRQFDAKVDSLALSLDNRYITASDYDKTTDYNTIKVYNAKTCELEHTHGGYKYWATMNDNSSYALSDDGWVCHFPHFGDQPRRLLWVPSQYRPSVPTYGTSLFTPTITGVQICLPRKNGLLTLIIPTATSASF